MAALLPSANEPTDVMVIGCWHCCNGGGVDDGVPLFMAKMDEIDGVEMIETAFVEANALASELGIRLLPALVTVSCGMLLDFCKFTFDTFDLSRDVVFLRALSSESLLISTLCFCCGGSGINEFCSRILFGICILREGILRIVVVLGILDVLATFDAFGRSSSTVVDAGVSADTAASVCAVTTDGEADVAVADALTGTPAPVFLPPFWL